MIRKLREFHIGQVIRHEGPATHRTKAGTPTMGGLLILTATLVPTLLWADLRNPFIWIAVLATAAFGAIGFADDYLKIVRRSHHGLLPRYKLFWQFVVGLSVGAALMALAMHEPPLFNSQLIFPFFKRLNPSVGLVYVAFAALVLTFSVRPLTVRQLLFTFVIPLVPLFYAWDGQASLPRIYTLKDLDELLAGLQSSDYVWEKGYAKTEQGKNKGIY